MPSLVNGVASPAINPPSFSSVMGPSNASLDHIQPAPRWFASAVFLIFALAIALRLIGLSRYGFDGDEIFSLMASNAGWPDLFSIAVHDVSHPPLCYILLKLWLMLAPQDEAWVRLLPMIFGVASLAVVAKICSVLRIGKRDTLLALLLMAVNGMLIYQSQHARMFSLLQFTSSLSLYYFVLCAREPVTRARFATLVLVNLIMVYSHYWGWVFLFGELVAMLYIDRAKAMVLAWATACVAVGFAPWALAVANVVVNRGTATRQISWMGAGTPGISDYTWLFGELNGSLSFAHSTILGIALYGIPIAVFAYVSLSKKITSSEKLDSPVTWIVLTMTPPLVTSAASYLSHHNLWGERHMIIVAIPYYVMLALALSRSSFVKLSTALRFLILLWSLVAGTEALADTHQNLDWKMITASIAADRTSPMMVYSSEPFVTWALRFHVARALGENTPVIENGDPASIVSNKFWYVYRNETWRGPNIPEKILATEGYLIDREVSTVTKSQTVTALLAHKPPGSSP